MRKSVLWCCVVIFCLILFASCNSTPDIQIPGASKQFNIDTAEIVKIIKDDIKNNTNVSGLDIETSPTNIYLNKYIALDLEGKLSDNEKKVLGIVSNAASVRLTNYNDLLQLSYTFAKGIEQPKLDSGETLYFEEIDEMCEEILKEIYLIK